LPDCLVSRQPPPSHSRWRTRTQKHRAHEPRPKLAPASRASATAAANSGWATILFRTARRLIAAACLSEYPSRSFARITVAFQSMRGTVTEIRPGVHPARPGALCRSTFRSSWAATRAQLGAIINQAGSAAKPRQQLGTPLDYTGASDAKSGSGAWRH
jgi:hypothetical protein